MNKLSTVLSTSTVFVAAITCAAPGLDAATQETRLSQGGTQGIRGDVEAIADAEAMVETMGGMAIWAELESIHLVHEWYPWHRVDSYVENEVLDFTGPRSRADRKSEINHMIRAYSPEGGRWTLNEGEFARAGEEVLEQDLARAPFNFFRLVRAVAAGDQYYEVRFGEGDIPGTRRLEFYGPEGVLGGWIILNARKEPIVKATPAYRYTLGPLKRFGNLRVPAWGVYDNGTTRYKMLSLSADDQPPDLSLFLPPVDFRPGN
ncbi:MAG: hypothetical protein KAI98_07445 [Gemmatimonadetes bacterium]|nr:hypothetical protein [Gemmatimonadota bacterium]